MKRIPSRSTQRREALYALAMSESMPDAGVLDDIVRQYPQFSRELTKFAVELALDSLVEGEAAEAAADPTKVSPAVSRAVSAFHNRLYTLRRTGRAGGGGAYAVIGFRGESVLGSRTVGNSEGWPSGSVVTRCWSSNCAIG